MCPADLARVNYMRARRDARASRDLSDVLMKANPEDYGFHEDRINLDKLTVSNVLFLV